VHAASSASSSSTGAGAAGAGAPQGKTPTRILISAQDSVTAALKYTRANFLARPLVKNFGSDRFPGGGYSKGTSMAQDEAMCYASPTLFSVLKTHYQRIRDKQSNAQRQDAWLQGTDCIYVPHVAVARDPKTFKETSAFELIDVLYLPAIRHPRLTQDKSAFADVEDMKLLEDKIRVWYRLAKQYGHRILIDGAWGTGCFGNPPQVIIEATLRILDEPEFHSAFDIVEFAMLNGYGPAWDAFKKCIDQRTSEMNRGLVVVQASANTPCASPPQVEFVEFHGFYTASAPTQTSLSPSASTNSSSLFAQASFGAATAATATASSSTWARGPPVQAIVKRFDKVNLCDLDLTSLVNFKVTKLILGKLIVGQNGKESDLWTFFERHPKQLALVSTMTCRECMDRNNPLVNYFFDKMNGLNLNFEMSNHQYAHFNFTSYSICDWNAPKKDLCSHLKSLVK